MQKLMAILAALLAVTTAQAGFINGGFEDGNLNGWTGGNGFRGSLTNTQLANGLNGFTNGFGPRSSIVTPGLDPLLGNKMDNTVYSGNYAFRVENLTNGGFYSVISQTVNNYTDANIFFAWMSVLEGAHGVDDAATMIIKLTDLTTNTDIITRQYNAANGGSGVDPRFSYDPSTNLFYTQHWQIEQLAIGPGLSGHNFRLTVLAADCEPTGHLGYVYLDGFGAVNPAETPEPLSIAVFGGLVGVGGLAAVRRRKA